MPSAAVVLDGEGLVVAVNAAGEDLLGISAAAARGKPVEGAFHVFLDRARRMAPDEAVRFSHPFGASWFMVRSFPLRGTDGKGTLHVLDAVDITAMKNAEFEVRESEQRLEEATRIAQLGTFKLQWDTGAMQWSPHVYTILGLAPDSFVYSFGRYRAMVHPDDRESYDRLHEDLLDGKGIRSAEHRIIRPDGNVRWLRVEGRVLFDAEGLPYASFGTYQDITEAKQRVREILENAKHTVDDVDSGTAALKILKANKYDLIVSDIWMPGMDGIALLKEIRGSGDNIPVVVISGGAPNAPLTYTAPLAATFGAKVVIYKPFEKAELLNAISIVLSD